MGELKAERQSESISRIIEGLRQTLNIKITEDLGIDCIVRSVACCFIHGVGETYDEATIDCCESVLHLWEYFNEPGEMTDDAILLRNKLNGVISRAMFV